MREIQLTRGQVAVVDDDDFDKVSAHKWQAHWNKNIRSFYAITTIFPGRKFIHMHRFVMGISERNVKVDHRNHDTLDNQKDNLRVCTPSQGQMNRRSGRNTSSRFRGVMHTHAKKKPWRAMIGKNYIYYSLGQYAQEIDAAKAYNRAALELHGEFACLNEIDQ